MFGWLRKKLWNVAPRCPWNVTIANDMIVICDGQGFERKLSVSDVRRVIVATDDSGPWGDDVVFLVYSDDQEPVGIFPLEAEGCQAFVAWLSKLPGYRDRELAGAMGSTSVARFEIFSAND